MRWLAVRRWRLLALTVALVCLRIAVELFFVFVAERPGWQVRTIFVVLFSIAMCGGIVATIVAFVQYGRIFNPRIPTE